MFADLGRYGLLDGRNIADRYFDGGDRVPRRRLAALHREGYLARHSVGEYFYANGRQPFVYALTERGAECAMEHCNVKHPRTLSEVSPGYVAHTLSVSQFLLRLDESAESAGVETPKWLHEYDLTEAFRNDPNPRTPFQQRYLLHETFTHPVSDKKRKAFSYRADAAFQLNFQGHTLLGYIEVDRSTEPLRKFAHKLPGLVRLISEQRFRNHWNNLTGITPTIRCYVLTRSKRRIRSISNYVTTMEGQGYLRFTTEGDLHRNLLVDSIWNSVESPEEKGAVLNA